MARQENLLEQLANVPPTSYRRRDRIAWAQAWLPVLALAVVGLFWLGEWLRHGAERYAPGPLAHVHATWDNRCAACHATARPLNEHNWASAVFSQSHVADAQCQTCHAGPRHHASERPADVPGCTSCHREHRGRDADLKRVANERCIHCHRHLASHVMEGAPSSYLDVTSFAGAHHPEFRVLRDRVKDPGRVAFNHHLHLAEGLRERGNTTVPFTLADMPGAFRERYRAGGQSDRGPVRLDCAACHCTDNDRMKAEDLAGLPKNAVLPPRTAGASMLPIVYEQHCQACHPLTFAAPDGKNPHAEQPKVRHRMQPDEVHAWLRGYFADRALKDQLPFLEQPARPLPGKDPKRAELAKKIGAALQGQIEAAERILFGPSTCGKCHTALKIDLGAGQRVEPAAIPAVWLTSARFDHTSHRAVACPTCHAGVEESRTQADVLLPGVQVCQTCHAPAAAATRLPPLAQEGGGGVGGGARHDCTECHRYHGGDEPWHGRGAASRSPPRGALHDVRRFLMGTSNE